MLKLGVNETREKFLSFFEGKGHLRLPSFSLVPQNDASLLLINSGMAPMKKYFTGEVTPPRKRVSTCQKCIRTPDIENVGKTSRHGTFFEMLGNFSFGDYFKKEAAAWAWEFFTQVLEIPPEKLFVSVYLEDDEAFDIWTKNVGVSQDHMVRLGKEDNFWEHGSGPCGPCSEIYFDRGEKYGCGSGDCRPGCDCDRYIEVWNLVFTQFDSDGKGAYTPLDHPNIDTGMGLERLACVLQGVENLFEIDTVQNIIKHVCEITGLAYHASEKTDISIRVITDHIRSTVFMISDGVRPSNEGRGYVLRRLLRRAARHGRLLNIERPFLHELAGTVINESKAAYPELEERGNYILSAIKAEEARFGRTISQGTLMLSGLIDRLEASGKKALSGKDAFLLYDTFGFPIDLTREILAERSIALDEEGFRTHMEAQRVRAREARAKIAETSWLGGPAASSDAATVFVGYEQNESPAAVLYIIGADGKPAESLQEGEGGAIVLNQTPFYAESGGQVGDWGEIVSEDGANIEVRDCRKTAGGQYQHIVLVKEGDIKKGDRVLARIDASRREAIRRNHTSLHMLQAALRQVLGEHVHQAGSYVDDRRGRFDFSHYEAMTTEEIRRVEELVNEKILEGIPIKSCQKSMDEAKRAGAMALFGEKYGDIVRVVSIGDYSTELCGGTHADNSAKLGLFKILSETSVAAGTRRIECTTGRGVLELIDERESLLEKSAGEIKLRSPSELPEKLRALVSELKEKNKEIEALNGKLADGHVQTALASVKQIGEIKYAAAFFEDESAETLRGICDRLRGKDENIVALIANRGTLAAAAGKGAIAKGLHAGKLVKDVSALLGGKGGGRPDSAMAGFKDFAAVSSALEKAAGIIENFIKK
ncbi:MAG: alanine--tRNA ligase [Oscillospiraceae bacterium]|jgi:alanyl-tRNA synthetase|nr:alanine--tRNA ligase [Oscillospiraceae bacterium]